MSNESYEDIQPDEYIQPWIERMMEDYLLLRRKGKAPAIEAFIKRYPEEHRQALKEKIEEYEQLHLVFSALQQYQAEKFASELSEEQVNAAYERFQGRRSHRPSDQKAHWPLMWVRRLAIAFQTPIWAPALASVVVLGLVVFIFSREARYRAFDRQLTTQTAAVDALKQQNESLQQENAALRGQVEKAVASHEQTRQLLTTQQTFEQEVAQLKNENEKLKKSLAQRTPPPRDLVSLQDTAGRVTIYSDGTLSLGKATLPSSISQVVFDLVTIGEVAPTQPVRVAMATLRGDATRGVLRSASGAEKPAPVPKSPVLTAVRSTAPTLQWEAVPGAQEYQVIVAYPEEKENGKVVWEGSAGTQTQVTLPSGVLQRGQVYLWQVEALVEGQSRLSPTVGFWVIDENTLHEVEAVERKTSTSALVLASVYEAHGLYEEALAKLERLTQWNPTNPFAQAMLYNLRRQLGRE